MKGKGNILAPLLAAAMAAAALAGAEPPSGTARLELSPQEFPYHRTAELAITAEGPADAEISFPDFSKIPEGIETTVTPPETLPAADGTRRMRQRCLLDVVSPGKYRLPDLRVGFARGDEKTETVLPGPLMSARDLTDAEKEAAQVFVDPAPVPRTSRGLSPWAALPAVLLALAGAGLMAARVIRRRRRAAEAAVPPWETAFQRLRTLQGAGLMESGRFDAFYVDLSAILRYYIEDRFGIPAPEQTTPEFLEQAHAHDQLTPDHQRFLADFLLFCDRVKFANHPPSRDRAAAHLDEVWGFVDGTIPRAETPAATEGAA